MARKFKELEDRMSPESRARSDAKFEELMKAMPLHELRAARRLTQQTIAQNLSISQAAVSRIEHRADVYVSTLRNFIKAVGGELEIIARFPDGEVRVLQFAEPNDEAADEQLLSAGA